MIKKTHLDFDFTPLLTADYTTHTGSCICHIGNEMPEIYAHVGGMPKSYVLENTKIHQLWWDNTQIDFDELGRQMGIEVVTVSTICQEPGCVVPYHKDSFYQIKKRHPDRTETKVRANIHLENYKIGHLIQYIEQDKIITNVDWLAGDGFIWDSEVLHLGANAGLENKYTMQISGFLKSN